MKSKRNDCLLQVDLSQCKPLNTLSQPLTRLVFFQSSVNGYVANLCCTSLFFVLSLLTQSVYAQTINENLLTCNTPANWVAGSGPPVSILTGNMPGHVPLTNPQQWTGNFGLNAASVTGTANIIDSNTTTNFGSFNYLLSASGGARVTVESTSGQIPAGYFAGFIIRNTAILNVNLLGTFAIKTYLNNTLQESIGAGSGLLSASLVNSGGKTLLGFVTSKRFDRLMLEQGQTVNLGTVAATEIYNPVIEKFCSETIPQNCNVDEYWNNPEFPVYINPANTGISTTVACISCQIRNVENAIDADSSNYAEIYIPGSLGSKGSVSVKNAKTIYNAGTFAGFEINDMRAAGVAVGLSHTITTYLNGAKQDSITDSGALIAGTLFASNGKRIVGLRTTKNFDEIQLTVTNALTAGTSNAIRVYGAVVKKFCEKNLTCDSLTALEAPVYPVYVNEQRTGVDVIACVNCALINTRNIVTGSGAATLTMSATVGATASVAVANATEIYPAESFAGFDIQAATLLSASLSANVSISLYNNGIEVQSGTGDSLLVGGQTSVVNGAANRQIVGIISRVAFNEVLLKIRNVAGVNPGIIQIYKAYVQKPCAKPAPCNFSKLVNSTSNGAVINAARTGVKGGVCVECSVSDPWNAVSESTDDYARLYNTGTAFIQNSLAVAVPSYTFPPGSFAGFSIRKNSFLVAATLFQQLTITTYNNGILQELKTGSSLIDLRVLSQVTGNDSNEVYIPGFYVTRPFDEVKITTNSLATALDQYIDVFGAYIDTKGYDASLSLGCTVTNTNADIAIAQLHVPVAGSVAQNDKIQADSVTYASSVAVRGGYTNPSSAMPVIQEDGSYSFVADTAGVYEFLVSVCWGDDSSCVSERFTITVVDNVPKSAKNPPVANTDIVTAAYNTPVVINTLANDKAGSPALQLVPSTVTITDLNGNNVSGNTFRGGTAVIDTATGSITYTPPAGFTGVDTIKYTVCDNGAVPKCASSYIVAKVLNAGAVNRVTAADDYYLVSYGSGKLTVNQSHGVLANDSDPEGNNIYAVPQDTSIAGKGILQLAADGSFTFVPEAGFKGSVNIPYAVYDDGSPVATAGGSIHIMVKAFVPDLTPTIELIPKKIYGTTDAAIIIEVKEINAVPTEGTIAVYVSRSIYMPLQFNSSESEIKGIPVQNSLWTVDSTSNANYYILKTTQSISGGKHTLGLTGTFTPGAITGIVSTTCIIPRYSGGEEYSSNNIAAVAIHFFEF
ncbi:MAG: Ig-like domain-containing protein [Agriterribacter sp.]